MKRFQIGHRHHQEARLQKREKERPYRARPHTERSQFRMFSPEYRIRSV
jgi:hypothetical protein